MGYDLNGAFDEVMSAVASGKGGDAVFKLEQSFHAVMGVEYEKMTPEAYESLGMGDKLPTGLVIKRTAVGHEASVPGLSEEQIDNQKNVLLGMERGLQTYRGVEHLVREMGTLAGIPSVEIEAQIAELRGNMNGFMSDMRACRDIDGDNFEATRGHEAKLNARMLNFLENKGFMRAGLDASAQEDVLKDMRFRAGLLDDRASFVSQYDHTVKVDVEVELENGVVEMQQKSMSTTHTSVAHPIAEKTPEQLATMLAYKEELKQTLANNPYDMQVMAQLAFADEAMKSGRSLPAQSRKTDPLGVKNGYLRHMKIDFPNGQAKHLYFTRAATVAYVGKKHKIPKGLSGEDLARQNLQQVEQAITQITGKDSKAHPVVLTSSGSHLALDKLGLDNKETRMYGHTLAAAKQTGGGFSYVPQNMVGVGQGVQVPEGLDLAGDAVKQKVAFLGDVGSLSHRSEATIKSGQVVEYLSMNDDNGQQIALVMCASGQDRTGNSDEAACEIFVNDSYIEALCEGHNYSEEQKAGIKQQISDQLKESLQEARAPLFEQAFYASAVAVGSLGQKEESMPTPDMGENYKGNERNFIWTPALLRGNFGHSKHTKTNKGAKIDIKEDRVAANDADKQFAGSMEKGLNEIFSMHRTSPESNWLQALKVDFMDVDYLLGVDSDAELDVSPAVRPIDTMLTQRLRQAKQLLSDRKGSWTAKNPASTRALMRYIHRLEGLQATAKDAAAGDEVVALGKTLLATDVALLKDAVDASNSKKGTLLRQCLGLEAGLHLALGDEFRDRFHKVEGDVAERTKVLGKFIGEAKELLANENLIVEPSAVEWATQVQQSYALLSDQDAKFSIGLQLAAAEQILEDRKDAGTGMFGFLSQKNEKSTHALEDYKNALQALQDNPPEGQVGQALLAADQALLHAALNASSSKDGTLLQQCLGLKEGLPIKAGAHFQTQFSDVGSVQARTDALKAALEEAGKLSQGLESQVSVGNGGGFD